MKRLSHLALAAMIVLSSVAATRGAQAPADEYFGPQKMSAIAIRSSIGKLARTVGYRWQDDASIFHDAQLIEQSYKAWAQRYPADSWLAPTAYHLAQLYQELHDQRARAAALSTASIDLTTLTPPALPRPPAWICAFTTTTGVLRSRAALTASPTENAG